MISEIGDAHGHLADLPGPDEAVREWLRRNLDRYLPPVRPPTAGGTSA